MYDETSEYEDESGAQVGLIAAETDSADAKDDESMQEPLVIAIDGPSGAGKAPWRRLASRLSILL